MLARLRHRLGQFFGALRPHVSAADRADACRYLAPGEQRLFESMMLRDQQHGIAVFRRIRVAMSGDDRQLLAAALLHDCGKGRVAIWQRVAHVVLGVAAPGLRRRIASERGAGWRRAFWRLLYHPDIGAGLAERAGADADVVRIIREQDSPHPDERLALLQAADEA
ncbi:MAG: HD domain-containing protein [Dehalococcoidia bacterium]|nr:MAG: HD domain-containing protein [Dehalococcoidia bacterium]